MSKDNIIEHPLVAQLKTIDLKRDKLSWELHDYIDSIIDHCDSEYLCGVEDYGNLNLLIGLLSPLVEECHTLEKEYPENQVVSHNRAIILLVTSNLYLSSMSRPRKQTA